jgi:hypothetical protein
MSASIVILPVIHLSHYECPHYLEQITRERQGLSAHPFRCRPLLVIDNDRARPQLRDQGDAA